jgi:hypothetical protein
MTKSHTTSKLKSTGRVLGLVATAVLDSPTRNRIAVIDAEIEKLQKERTELVEKLINKP